MEHQYRVQHSFAATTAGNGAKVKVFRPGETLSWDEEKHSNPIVFTGTGFKWRPDDAVEFTQSIERFQARKLGTA